MNYIISWLLCVAGTVLAALGGSNDWHWLLVSDANVTLFLALAYYIDKWRGSLSQPTTLNIKTQRVVLRDAGTPL
jgi:hypothetical protein